MLNALLSPLSTFILNDLNILLSALLALRILPLHANFRRSRP